MVSKEDLRPLESPVQTVVTGRPAGARLLGSGGVSDALGGPSSGRSGRTSSPSGPTAEVVSVDSPEFGFGGRLTEPDYWAPRL